MLEIRKTFSCNLYLYIHHVLSDDIVDMEKPDGICSLTFAADEFSGLFLHLSTFSITHSRFV